MTEHGYTGRVIVVSGPSGAGKTTLCRQVCEMPPDVHWSISATTRPPREGEHDGVDYYFISEEDFRRRVEGDGFAEHARVFDYLYGTPREPLELILSGGGCMLVDVDIQGAAALKGRYGDAVVSIFVTPSNSQELAGRLAARRTEGPREIAERLSRVDEELARKEEYDYVVINDDLEKAVRDFRTLLERITRTE